jgi:hypothetical protein
VHRTSRAGDPQFHIHVLVANVAKGEDGVWSAPDARLFYNHAPAAGYLCQAALRASLGPRIKSMKRCKPVDPRKGQSSLTRTNQNP